MVAEHINDTERFFHDEMANSHAIEVEGLDWTTRNEVDLAGSKAEDDDTPELVWDLPKADADALLDKKDSREISPEEAEKLDEIRRQLYESHHQEETDEEDLEKAA